MEHEAKGLVMILVVVGRTKALDGCHNSGIHNGAATNTRDRIKDFMGRVRQVWTVAKGSFIYGHGIKEGGDGYGNQSSSESESITKLVWMKAGRTSV